MKFLFDHDVPDDMSFSLKALGHEVIKLRMLTSPGGTADPHVGLIVLIRRRSRAHERAALVGLLDKAGDAGIRNNINFA